MLFLSSCAVSKCRPVMPQVAGPANIQAFLSPTLNGYMNLFNPCLLLEGGIPRVALKFGSGGCAGCEGGLTVTCS